MSPHAIPYRPAPQAARSYGTGCALIALVGAVIAVVAVSAITVWALRDQPQAQPVRQAAVLHVRDLQPAGDHERQLLTDIRAEAFRAGYAAALEREGCAHPFPPLSTPVGDKP